MQKLKFGKFAGALICAAVAAVLIARPAAADLADCREIKTDKGAVTGVLSKKGDVCSYRGVPFAAPPVGALRFALPAEHEPWAETLVADHISPVCPQGDPPGSSRGYAMDEDCLYLNIWQPVGAAQEKKPVMVFIHGGGFVIGSGGYHSYNSETLVRRGDVVAVTINYRLGLLGFLAHPALADGEGRSGNWGMHDQIQVLKWVKKNIAAFGGDPDNVTIFGQSAGGMSVGLLLASPLAAGLFQNASIHSAPPIYLNAGQAWGDASGLAVAAALGCEDPASAAACLRAIEPADLIEKAPPGIFIMDTNSEGKYYFQPIVDGGFLPDAPYTLFREGRFNKDVNVMVGSTTEEGAYFTIYKGIKTAEDFTANLKEELAAIDSIMGFRIDPEAIAGFYPTDAYPNPDRAYQDMICDVGFTCPVEAMAELISRHQPNVYRWQHAKAPFKMLGLGAFHSSELSYLFNYFAAMGKDYRSKDNLILSAKEIALWSAFAHTGSPQAEGLPEWPRYNAETRQYMRLDDRVTVESDLKREKCAAMAEIYESNFPPAAGAD